MTIIAGGSRCFVAAACLAVAMISVVSAQDYDGEWEGPFEMPFVPASAANLPDGRILAWASNRQLAFGGAPGYTWTGIFDPASTETSGSRISHTRHDMFCPGTATLPDGRIMVTGGANAGTVSIFDPFLGDDGEWTSGPAMNIGRGYHSSVLLPDGRVLSLGGSWSGRGAGGRTGEIWSEAMGSWTVYNGLDSDILATNDRDVKEKDNHYWTFVAPGGDIFHAGPSIQMHWLSVEGNGGISLSLPRGDDLDAMTGTAVMYDVGKILKIGGAIYYKNSDARTSTFVMDINGGPGFETVERSGDLNQPRAFVNAVVLPTGEVFTAGGATYSRTFTDQFAVMTSEIWNPATGIWKELSATMMVPRTYHSVAVLMKDARVWVGGGGLCNYDCGEANHPDSEIFRPPYLFNNDGSPAVRPTIMNSPANVELGGTGTGTTEIDVTAEGPGVLGFVIIRLGAVTHSTNLDQRRIPLTITRRQGNMYTLAITNNVNVCIPGSYYIFALSDDRVPSIAETVIITTKNQPTTSPVLFDVLLGTDLPGGDIGGARVAFAADATIDEATRQCADICRRLKDCVAFTASLNNGPPSCYPKNIVPSELKGPALNGRVNSGTKKLVPPSVPGYEILVDTDLVGPALPDSLVTFPAGTTINEATRQCAAVCSSLPGCESFVAAVNDGKGPPRCYPKGSAYLPKRQEPELVGRVYAGRRWQIVAPGYEILPGTDLVGPSLPGSYVAFPAGTTIEEATTRCAEVCDATVGCESFVAAVNDGKGPPRCYPKAGADLPVRQEPEYAGRVYSGRPVVELVVPGYEIVPDTDLVGRSIPDALVIFPDDTDIYEATKRCAEICDGIATCQSFVAAVNDNKGPPRCYPKAGAQLRERKEPEYVGRVYGGKKMVGTQ